MIEKTTEYQTLKRFLYAAKDFSTSITGTEANMMIGDACEEAYANLERKERVLINEARETLQAHVKNLGDRGSLELLAALGDLMNSREIQP